MRFLYVPFDFIEASKIGRVFIKIKKQWVTYNFTPIGEFDYNN